MHCHIPVLTALLAVLLPLQAGIAQTGALIVAALGDAGERGGILRGNAGLLENMRTGQHDGGRAGVLLFLGDNFGETGLNVPAREVDGEVSSTLAPFRAVLEELGPGRVHGIPGESEYFARKAVEKTALFGLITLAEWPVGLSDRGVRRAAARQEWSFHAGLPSSAVFPAGGEARDSVELIFFDSALLMRTETRAWQGALDSLRSLLRRSGARPGIGWRVLCAHHPLRSAGEHGGFSIWNDEDSTVEYVTSCDRDSNAFGFIRNWIDPEDLCTDRYRAYRDSVGGILAASGAGIQAVLSAHDRSLQLLAADGVLPLQIISGSGSMASRARLPRPPGLYTAAQRQDEGRSLPGFVQLRWEGDRMAVVFFSERNGERVHMGGGKTEFSIDRDGQLH